ncbi:MAG TPA: hypothetical protein VEF55_03865 [Candidatus Binatia bacterium]|nr:hypothetical protein [Candidatus Binatia bacterium]
MTPSLAASRGGPAAARPPRASLLLAIVVLIALMAASTLLRPTYFMGSAEALGLATRFGAFAYFIAAATWEEAAKAAAIGVADLRRRRLSWFWIVVILAGAMGQIEVVFRIFVYADSIGASDMALQGARTIAGHIALSLICVVLARQMRNWIGAVVVAGLLHAAINYGRMQTGFSIPYLAGTGLLFAGVIAGAYLWRAKFDWRDTA